MSETPETTVPQPPVERVFPPWSVGRIVFWIAVGVFLSIPVGGIVGALVTAAGIWLDVGVGPDLVQAATVLIEVVYGPFVFFLVFLLVKRKGFSMSDIWGPFFVKRSHLGLAILAGIFFMATATFIARMSHLEIPPTPLSNWDWRLLLAFDLLTIAYMVPIAEEFLFRGLLYRALRFRCSTSNSVLISSLVFALAHIQYLQQPFYLMVLFLLSVVSACLLERSRSLTSSAVFHVAFNAASVITESLTYYAS